MTRRHSLGKGDARAEAREEQEKAEQAHERGLCKRCREDPQNPSLNSNLCLSCHQDMRGGCMVGGCAEDAAGSLGQREYCEKHLIDFMHDEYFKLLDLKERINKLHRKIEMLEDKVEEPDDLSSTPPREMSSKERHLHDLKAEETGLQRNIEAKFGRIQDAADCVDEVFHENFEDSIGIQKNEPEFY